MFVHLTAISVLAFSSLVYCSRARMRTDDPNTLYSLTNYAVPISNGSDCSASPSKCLPSPTGTLKAVALGNGTQNYSCPANPTPSALGATANLFDLSPVLSKLNSAASGGPAYQRNTSLIESFLSTVPQNFLQGSENMEAKAPSQYGAHLKQFETSHPLLGQHFFNTNSVPTFALLNSLGEVEAKPASNILAPGGPAVGVPWLQLKSCGGNSAGVTQVYRVYTFGGSPAPGVCDGKPDGYKFTVPYAALYWFYGPA